METLIKAKIEIEILQSKDKKNRYILKKVWDRKLPKVTVLTLYPSNNDLITNDLTTTLITNNVYKMGYGGFFNVNLFSKIFTGKRELFNNKYNDDCILECVKNSELVIIACGSLPQKNKKVEKRFKEIINKIEYNVSESKLCYLTDVERDKCFHPLAPSVREKWNLMI